MYFVMGSAQKVYKLALDWAFEARQFVCCRPRNRFGSRLFWRWGQHL